MTEPVRLTLARRLQAAIAADGRDLRVLAHLSGCCPPTLTRLSKMTRNTPTPDVSTIWAVAGALDVDPHWLLGSDRHPPPQARSADRPARIKPARLPPAAWRTVREERRIGTPWPRVAALLLERHGAIVEVNTIRRAWDRQLVTNEGLQCPAAWPIEGHQQRQQEPPT